MSWETRSRSPTFDPGYGGGLSVSLLFSHNSFLRASRVVSSVLGGTVSALLSDHEQICMHVSCPNFLPPFQNRYVIPHQLLSYVLNQKSLTVQCTCFGAARHIAYSLTRSSRRLSGPSGRFWTSNICHCPPTMAYGWV